MKILSIKKGFDFSVSLRFEDKTMVINFESVVKDAKGYYAKYADLKTFYKNLFLDAENGDFYIGENRDIDFDIADLYFGRIGLVLLQKHNICEFSVSQYASLMGISRQAVLNRCAVNNMHEGFSSRKIGNNWVIAKV